MILKRILRTRKNAYILFLTTGQVFEHVVLVIVLDFQNQND